MEISYKREMKHNYLVIEGESTDNSYEVRMMADNVIEGLMKFRVKRVDNQCRLCTKALGNLDYLDGLSG